MFSLKIKNYKKDLERKENGLKKLSPTTTLIKLDKKKIEKGYSKRGFCYFSKMTANYIDELH